MATERRTDNGTFIFNSIYTAMGVLLLGVAGWIAINTAHIPVLEAKIASIESNVTSYMSKLDDHEKRIQKLEDTFVIAPHIIPPLPAIQPLPKHEGRDR